MEHKVQRAIKAPRRSAFLPILLLSACSQQSLHTSERGAECRRDSHLSPSLEGLAIQNQPKNDAAQPSFQQPYRSGYQWRPEDGIPQQMPYQSALAQPMPIAQPQTNLPPQLNAQPGYQWCLMDGTYVQYALPQAVPAPSQPIPIAHPGYPSIYPQPPYHASAPDPSAPPYSGLGSTPDSAISNVSFQYGHRRSRSRSMDELRQITSSSSIALEQAGKEKSETDTDADLPEKYAHVSPDMALRMLREAKTAAIAELMDLIKTMEYEENKTTLQWEDIMKKAASQKSKTQSPTSQKSFFSTMATAASSIVTSKEQKATKARQQALDQYQREIAPVQNHVLRLAGTFDSICLKASSYKEKIIAVQPATPIARQLTH